MIGRNFYSGYVPKNVKSIRQEEEEANGLNINDGKKKSKKDKKTKGKKAKKPEKKKEEKKEEDTDDEE